METERRASLAQTPRRPPAIIEQAVAYYRVSSELQAQSGRSLDRQQHLVRQYAALHNMDLISEQKEIESAYRRGSVNLQMRPGLQEALRVCKAKKATLLIATLDRLSRKVVLIATLIETRVKFVALDLPDATPFMLHIFAAIAEEESRQRGRLISAAWALKKSRGKVSKPNIRLIEAARRRAEKYLRVLEKCIAAGVTGSYRITKELRRRGVRPPTAKPWTCIAVVRLIARLGMSEQMGPTFSERRAASAVARAHVEELRSRGFTYAKIAELLNKKHLVTWSRKPWTAERVLTLLRWPLDARTRAERNRGVRLRDGQ